MFLRQFLAVHQEGEHHVILHRACERNAVVVTVDAAKDDITCSVRVRSAVDEQFLERDAAPGRRSHTVAAGECVDAHEGGDLIIGVSV